MTEQALGFRLRRRQHLPLLYLPLLALALGAAAFVVWRALNGGSLDHLRELLLAAVGGLAALTYFLYGQHRDETRLFIDLFREFNKRFDDLNDKLNPLVGRLAASPAAMLSESERQTLFDYFNLCAEEHLFMRSGYLDEEVWQSWRRGMRFFAAVPAIRTLWASEIESGSYYAFTLGMLDED